MYKVLVCGSEGSLGQAIIPLLLEKGHTVHGADNLTRYGERLGIAGKKYKFHKIDLRDFKAVNKLFKEIEPDYVIQMAAQIYGVGGFNAYCADILGGDLTLHDNILKNCIYHGVKKIIYTSSSMVYESCPQNTHLPVSEGMPDHWPAPHTEYGLSKFVGERMCKAFNKEYQLPYTIWRPFNIITPHEKSDENTIGISHVFADYIDNIILKQARPLPIIGSGDQIRCFTWIGDIAEAIVNYSFDPITDNETYNLGNPEPITMKELANKIKTIAATEFNVFPDYEMEFKTIGNYKNDVQVRIPDVTKASNTLNWNAKLKVDDSIRICIKEVLKNG